MTKSMSIKAEYITFIICNYLLLLTLSLAANAALMWAETQHK